MVSRHLLARVLVPLAVGLIFFAYTFIPASAPPGRWNSPDEASNAFFIKLFAEKGDLSVFEPLNFVVGDRVHPRSVAAVNGYLVPGGFLGTILIYGTLARLLGIWIVPFLTPLLAVAGVLAFAALMRPVFGKGIAVIAAALLALHPAYWYYSARGLFPNVPILVFAILGAYFLLRRPFRSRENTSLARVLDDVLGAVFLTFAVWTRPSELIWLAPAFILLAVAFRSELGLMRLARLVAVLVLGVVFLSALNRSLYGDSLASGYNAPPDNHEVAFHAGLYPSSDNATRSTLPFGVHPRSILKNAWDYGLRFFWWYTLPALAGIVLALRDWRRGVLRLDGKLMLILLGWTTAVLGVVYGSGVFTDTSQPDVLSLGDSHTRYFLPAYALAIPFAAMALKRLASWMASFKRQTVLLGVILLVIAGLSTSVVYWSEGEGLLAVQNTLRRYERVAARVQELVPSAGVVVTDRNDKVFFPERRVVVPLRDPGTFKALPVLARRAPLFYYGITLAADEFAALNAGTFGESGLVIAPLESFGSETLYRIQKK